MDAAILDDELRDFAHDVIMGISRFADVVDETKLVEIVDFFANMRKIDLSGQRKTAVLRKVEASVCHNRPYDFTVFSEQYRPWFDAFWKTSPRHHYWDRYFEYLLTIKEKPLPLQHAISLDKITSTIVDHMENPQKTGPWSRRGMMVGQVQSGKTATYIGVAAKAADCGYRFIVIMAGTLNALRNQTQGRVDEGFIGKQTAGRHKGEPVGVGLVPGEDADRKPTSLTTTEQDFRKIAANTFGLAVGGTFEPIILVIKKNANTLANLLDWIRTNTSAKALKDLPFLLIDDESDYASVNVKKPENEPTRINGQIRDLLNLFGRNCYLGCTATPFANIFIDPDANSEAHGNDLFPRDFILTLDAPDTYMGPEVFFGNNALDLLRSIDDVSDTEGYIPIRHRKGYVVPALPDSLEDALHVFVLAKTMRMIRGEKDFHCSALVNASRFKDVHAQLAEQVREVIERIQNAVETYSALDENSALAEPTMARLKRLFDNDYATVGEKPVAWKQVQGHLADAVKQMDVLMVNSDASARELDYSRENWPHGRTIVVVGGMSLSRGLTLEGLVVSYYLRNSIAYDTLMQMGRWFGYRPGYGDLCRVYMTDLCQDWYQFITAALGELNDDFHAMNAFCMTPEKFGLRVRAHPSGMIVTARNKMRSAKHVTIRLNYLGSLVETAKLSAVPDDNQSNRKHLERWLRMLGPGSQENALPSYGWLWHDVPAESIATFCEGFRAHPLDNLDKIRPVCQYIRKALYFKKWDVFLATRLHAQGEEDICRIVGMDVVPDHRSMKGAERPADRSETEAVIRVNGDNLRVGYASQERAGLLQYMAKADIEAKEEAFIRHGHKSISGNIYRELRWKHGANPLLIVHIISSNDKQSEAAALRRDLVALSWSFPGDSDAAMTAETEEYEVNAVWYKNYLMEREEESDEYDDDVEDPT